MKLILLISMILLVILVSNFFISTNLVSAASARGTFTIQESEPQLSPDENQTNSTETTDNQQPAQSSFITMIKNFFKALFGLFRK